MAGFLYDRKIAIECQAIHLIVNWRKETVALWKMLKVSMSGCLKFKAIMSLMFVPHPSFVKQLTTMTISNGDLIKCNALCSREIRE